VEAGEGGRGGGRPASGGERARGNQVGEPGVGSFVVCVPWGASPRLASLSLLGLVSWPVGGLAFVSWACAIRAQRDERGTTPGRSATPPRQTTKTTHTHTRNNKARRTSCAPSVGAARHLPSNDDVLCVHVHRGDLEPQRVARVRTAVAREVSWARVARASFIRLVA
jgi:hypothetical protein